MKIIGTAASMATPRAVNY